MILCLTSLSKMNGNHEKVDEETRGFLLTNNQLCMVSDLLLREFLNGLGRSTHDSATVKLFPTYVRDVPDGSEQGKFLGLDMGGTNLRVWIIDLHGDQFHLENDIYEFPQELKLSSGEQLFDYVAECLADFLKKKNLSDLTLSMGLTFSFPCRQEGLTSARLVKWTKGFKCSGVVDQDVVLFLRQALHRRGDIDVDVVAIVNDTTATLMSCAHRNRECRIASIVGTGTNACYMEKMENVETWDGDVEEPRQVIVNTEWGAFGDSKCLEFIRTEFDRQVDINSLNPGRQMFEKMISGMYMGEIVRRVVVKCIEKKYMLNGHLSERFKTPHAFKSRYVSNVDSDSKQQYKETTMVFEKMGASNATTEDFDYLKIICSRVSTRAAYLVASGVATILNKIKRPHTTIGIDGSVYRYHPYFKDLVEKKVMELTIPDYKFDLMLSGDGSGKGAALVAAVAVRSKNQYV